ncbi:hypothetical protein AR438_10955 [Chryseobacterium aquaticum]|uniref:Uncharacterized protein n=1 Tax=Chryseobacterium aquaticum TaxID=452084 RepID=A0A0Q3KPL6_9FLAO|nr:hypothetical protein [Chryseobacterium aquaticum]KQK26092.1 hypothetical protein AR438_10955 [Chryseobacterium aquaticum]
MVLKEFINYCWRNVDEKLKFIGAMLVWFIPAVDGISGAQFHPLKQHIVANEYGILKWNL